MLLKNVSFRTRRKIVRVRNALFALLLVGTAAGLIAAIATAPRSAHAQSSHPRKIELPKSATIVQIQLNNQHVLHIMGVPKMQEAIDEYLSSYPTHHIVSLTISDLPERVVVVFSPACSGT